MKTLLKFIFVICVVVSAAGCTNTRSAVNGGGNTYDNLNAAYNRKNRTAGRSMAVDTIIATALYNYPELVPRIGIGKTRSRTKTNINSVSNTTGSSQTFMTNNGFGTMSQSMTTTKTHTKSRTKSTSAGIEIAPDLNFFLK